MARIVLVLRFVVATIVVSGRRSSILPHRGYAALSGRETSARLTAQGVGRPAEASITISAAHGVEAFIPPVVLSPLVGQKAVERKLMEVLARVSVSQAEAGNEDSLVAELLGILEAARPSTETPHWRTLIGDWKLQYSNELPDILRSHLTQDVEDSLVDLSMTLSIDNNGTIMETVALSFASNEHKVDNLSGVIAQRDGTLILSLADLDIGRVSAEVAYISKDLLVLRKRPDAIGAANLLLPSSVVEVWRRADMPLILPRATSVQSLLWRFGLPRSLSRQGIVANAFVHGGAGKRPLVTRRAARAPMAGRASTWAAGSRQEAAHPANARPGRLESMATRSARVRRRRPPDFRQGRFISALSGLTLAFSGCFGMLLSPRASPQAERASTKSGCDDTANAVDGKDSLRARVISLALPALGALCLDPLMSLVDTICVSRAASSTPLPLAAMGAACTIAGVAISIFNFLTSATAPLVASRRAGGDNFGAAAVGGQALTVALLIGMLLAIGLNVFAVPLLAAIGSKAAGTLSLAVVVLRIRAMAAPAVLLISASTGICRGCLDTVTPLRVLTAATVLNVLLDVVFIFGFGWGAVGASAATMISEWCAAAALLWRLKGGVSAEDKPLCKVWFARSTLNPSDAMPLLKASAAIFGRTLVLHGVLAGSTALATFGGGASAAAAHELARQLWSLCAFVADSLAAAAQALVASALGQNDTRTANRVASVVARYGIMLGLILSTCVALLVWCGLIPELLTQEPSTLRAVRPLLMIVILAQPLNALVFVADGIILGARDYRFQLCSIVLACLLSVAVLMTTIGFRGGAPQLVDIWFALFALNIGRGITATWRYVLDPNGPLRERGEPLAEPNGATMTPTSASGQGAVGAAVVTVGSALAGGGVLAGRTPTGLSEGLCARGPGASRPHLPRPARGDSTEDAASAATSSANVAGGEGPLADSADLLLKEELLNSRRAPESLNNNRDANKEASMVGRSEGKIDDYSMDLSQLSEEELMQYDLYDDDEDLALDDEEQEEWRKYEAEVQQYRDMVSVVGADTISALTDRDMASVVGADAISALADGMYGTSELLVETENNGVRVENPVPSTTALTNSNTETLAAAEVSGAPEAFPSELPTEFMKEVTMGLGGVVVTNEIGPGTLVVAGHSSRDDLLGVLPMALETHGVRIKRGWVEKSGSGFRVDAFEVCSSVTGEQLSDRAAVRLEGALAQVVRAVAMRELLVELEDQLPRLEAFEGAPAFGSKPPPILDFSKALVGSAFRYENVCDMGRAFVIRGKVIDGISPDKALEECQQLLDSVSTYPAGAWECLFVRASTGLLLVVVPSVELTVAITPQYDQTVLFLGGLFISIVYSQAAAIASIAVVPPVSVLVLFILFTSEICRQRVAQASGADLGLPVFLPSPAFGSFGAVSRPVTTLKSAVLAFDMASAALVSAFVVSFTLIAAGILLPASQYNCTWVSPSVFPYVLQQLLYAGVAADPRVCIDVPPDVRENLLPVPSVLAVGCFGAAMTALNTLPIGKADGTAIASASPAYTVQYVLLPWASFVFAGFSIFDPKAPDLPSALLEFLVFICVLKPVLVPDPIFRDNLSRPTDAKRRGIAVLLYVLAFGLLLPSWMTM